jgi:hypothetical protein
MDIEENEISQSTSSRWQTHTGDLRSDRKQEVSSHKTTYWFARFSCFCLERLRRMPGPLSGNVR